MIGVMSLPAEIVKDPCTVEAFTDAMTAACRMDLFNVGSLIVVDGGRPVGMLTDRDLALFVIEGERDPASCSVAECMNEDVVTIGVSESPTDAIELLRLHGIRRLPIVDGDGRLVGIVAADDLVQYLARELADLGCAIRRELAQEGMAAGMSGSRVLGKE